MDIPYTLTARPDTGLYNGKLGIWLFLASEVMLFGALFTAYLFMRLGADEGTWPAHMLNVPLGLTNTFLLIMSSITMVYAWVALKERKLNRYRAWLAATILCGMVFLCIKGYEYYSKYQHWGFCIKEDAIGKYQDELNRMDALLVHIPSQHVWQVSGHREFAEEEGENADKYVFLPDANFHRYGEKIDRPADVKVLYPFASGAGGELDKPFAVDKSDVERENNFLPHYGTYYAIYFLVTGLHALHIIGGLIVMLYFLTIGSNLYRRNPEQLCNRLEVTGIFWHFVDLVWITVFPILYLM